MTDDQAPEDNPGSRMEAQSIEFKSAWSLTADGALATETTVPDFQGGGAPITIKATYKKG